MWTPNLSRPSRKCHLPRSPARNLAHTESDRRSVPAGRHPCRTGPDRLLRSDIRSASLPRGTCEAVRTSNQCSSPTRGDLGDGTFGGNWKDKAKQKTRKKSGSAASQNSLAKKN